MKKNFFATMLIAAVTLTAGLTSCNNDDEATAQNGSGEDKSVYVQISSGPETRSVGNPIGASTPIVFDNGHLFFVNAAGVITKHLSIGTSGDCTVAQLKAGHAVTNVPGDSKSVYVLGQVPSTVTVPSTGAFSAVQALTVTVAQQADVTDKVDNVTLYGGATGNITGSGPYTANIAVKPIGARVEIAKMTAAGVLTGYTVEGIYINNYFGKSKISGVIDGSDLPTHNGSIAANYAVGAPGLYTANLLNDEAGTLAGTMSGLSFAPSTAGKVWAYNVLAPSDAANDASQVPHVIIKLSNITATAASGLTFSGTHFLTIKGFKNAGVSVSKFETGKAYKLSDIVFTETNLTKDPETAAIDVNCTITLVDWTTIDVTPEL